MHTGPEQIDLIAEKFVSTLYLNAVLAHHVLGEIPLVLRDDHLGAAPDGSGQDMTIIRIRQRQRLDEFFVTGNQAVIHSPTHQFPSSLQFLGLQVWTVGLKVSEYLVQNVIGPPRLKNVGNSEPDEDVSEHVGVEHIGIKDNGKPAYSYSPISSVRAVSSSAAMRPAMSRWCLYSWTSEA